MYNLRYHIASLVGVFLALALGLVLGGLVVQRGTMDRQQGSLIEGLQREFATLRSDNETLEAENERITALNDALVDAWVTDRMVGKNVLVMSVKDSADTDAVSTAISAAGGNPMIITFADPAWADSAVAAIGVGEAEPSNDVTASVAASLVAEWYDPTTERPITASLVEAGAITVEGLDPGMGAAGVVNIATWDGAPDVTALAVSVAIREQDVAVVAAQTPVSESQLAAVAYGAGLSAIDTLGTSMGRYSLVALLTGAQHGYYGLADAASAAFPPLP